MIFRKWKVESGKWKKRQSNGFSRRSTPPFPFPPSPLQRHRRAISLVEILISMFVLLFGLMGVAAIFPVGNHYIVEGEKFDIGSNLAQNAFEELRARGLLRPEFWHYADTDGSFVSSTTDTGNTEFIQPSVANAPGRFNAISVDGPGHAFVLDPMGTATAVAPNPTLPNLDIFPYDDSSGSVVTSNFWNSSFPPADPRYLSGMRWPLRRLTVLDTGGLMTTSVAETIFRLRDDLVTTQPEQDDRPGIQAWDVNGANLLRRQYKGDYSWLATIVPTSDEALEALQPSDPAHSDSLYDVSVVVFRKRDTTPSAESERLIEAEILSESELAIYTSTGTDADVDAALEDIRPGGWIAVMGVNQTTGDFILNWYRLLALDDETDDVVLNSSTERGRYAMLDGPEWPNNSYTDLHAMLLPGAISVVTKQLKMEE